MTPSFRESVTATAGDETSALFRDIAAADELAVVPALASYLLSNASMSSPAKAAIRQIFSGRAPDDLGRLDEICRQFSTYGLSNWRWSQLKPRNIRRIATSEDVQILGLLSFHPSGWVRSKALKCLDRIESGDEEATASDNFRIRRGAYRAAYKLGELQRAEFIKQALRDADALIRLHAARQASALSDVIPRKELMGVMLTDKWHAVRTVALRMAVSDAGDSAKSILLGLVLDRSVSVRSSARYHLRQMGVDNFRDYYRDAISGKNLLTAIMGLSECGIAEDAAVVRPHLESARPRIIAAAVTAVSRLLPNESDALLLEYLAHRHRAPSNAAKRQLMDRVTTVTQAEIARDQGADDSRNI